MDPREEAALTNPNFEVRETKDEKSKLDKKLDILNGVVAAEPTLERQIDAEVEPWGEQPVDDYLDTMWAELEAMQLTEGGLDEYLAVDDQLATGGTRSLTEIAANVSTAEELEAGSDTEVMGIEEAPQPLVTAREATASFKVFQRFVEQNFSDPNVMQLTDKVDDFLAKERVQKFKQKNLLDFFSPDL